MHDPIPVATSSVLKSDNAHDLQFYKSLFDWQVKQL
jgi:hypothetical protein